MRLTDVKVVSESEATAVHIKTAGAVKYRAELIEDPSRLVIDFEDTVYGWRRAPLDVATPPVRQIRGSQYRKDVARVVVELTRKAAYEVRENADGLTVTIPATAADAAPGPRTASKSPAPVATTTALAATPAVASGA
ncbi:MAG: AMIN domain-containing protein, partial [Candidatus Rokuibacteriota bacterium]